MTNFGQDSSKIGLRNFLLVNLLKITPSDSEGEVDGNTKQKQVTNKTEKKEKEEKEISWCLVLVLHFHY